MLTRVLHADNYRAGCAGAPPPLHVVPQSAGQSWYPAPRPALADQPKLATFIQIPVVAPFGDDPTDPANQWKPHRYASGMAARFNIGPYGMRTGAAP